MAQLKFYRKSEAPSSPVAGAIWFNTTDKTIQIYTGSEWEKYAGNLKDATWSTDKKTLTITKQDGSSIALNFSDMASATVMGKMLTAVGLNTDGTFKKNATNYGGSALSIGGEITAIDAALKNVSDLVGTTSVATQISDAKTELTGSINDNNTVNTIYGVKAFATVKANAAEGAAKNYTDGALEALAGTVSSTAGEKVVVSVNQTNGKVDTVTVTLDDIASASELAGVKATAEAAQTAGEVSTAITNAINDLDATVEGTSTNVDVEVVETDGKITAVNVTNKDIASAAILAEVKGKVDAFFAGASIDDTVNQYKDTLLELQTYITEDAAAAVTLTESIAANKNDIVKLAGAKVNNKNIATISLGSDGTTTIVAHGVTLDGSDVKLNGYVKNSASNVSITAADTINDALGKLEAKADKALTDASDAAAAGVTSLNGNTGAVTIATGTSNGTIKVGDADVAVKGLGSAAYTESSAYASATDFQNLSTLVGTSSNGTNTGIFKVIEENEKTTASALTDLDTRLQDVESKKSSIESALQASDITTGSANGTISVKGSDVQVKGLGSAAYTEASVYATAAQGAKADTAYQKPEAGIPLTDLASSVYTQEEVDAMWAWAEF